MGVTKRKSLGWEAGHTYQSALQNSQHWSCSSWQLSPSVWSPRQPRASTRRHPSTGEAPSQLVDQDLPEDTEAGRREQEVRPEVPVVQAGPTLQPTANALTEGRGWDFRPGGLRSPRTGVRHPSHQGPAAGGLPCHLQPRTQPASAVGHSARGGLSKEDKRLRGNCRKTRGGPRPVWLSI